MKNKISRIFLPLLLIATVVGCTNGTKTDSRQALPAVTHDTVQPQFPGGKEALDKHLKEIKEMIIIEVDEKGKASYVNYGSRIIVNDDKTIKLINALPNWTPGKIDGKPTRFCFIYDNYEKAPLFKCINAGERSDRHELAKLWTLCKTESKGLETHPIYKLHKNDEIHISFNYNYELLQTIGTSYFDYNNESEYLYSVVSDSTNKFAIRHNDNVAITYSYKISKDGNRLTTYYTDKEGNRQYLIWVNTTFFEKNDFLKNEKVVPPPPQAKQITEIIQIVEDDEIEDSEIMSVEDQGEVVEFNEDANEETVESERIYQPVELQPEFPGGIQALMKFLKENVQYPSISRENNSQGKTYVNFVVNTDGSIQNVEVMKSSGDENLDNEAIRFVKTMPKWSPGKQDGKPVRVRFTIPVVFILQ